jgi:hypothetical protein
MGTIKQYKPKEQNINKLKLYLKKLTNGRKENKSINGEKR